MVNKILLVFVCTEMQRIMGSVGVGSEDKTHYLSPEGVTLHFTYLCYDLNYKNLVKPSLLSEIK
jgi:hypothetical protein